MYELTQLVCIQARKEAVKIINEALEKRKDSIEKQGDFLDTLLEEMKKEGSIFYKESIVSLLLNIGFVSRDSTSYATALTVNFISKNPRVLTELKVINIYSCYTLIGREDIVISIVFPISFFRESMRRLYKRETIKNQDLAGRSIKTACLSPAW